MKHNMKVGGLYRIFSEAICFLEDTQYGSDEVRVLLGRNELFMLTDYHLMYHAIRHEEIYTERNLKPEVYWCRILYGERILSRDDIPVWAFMDGPGRWFHKVD